MDEIACSKCGTIINVSTYPSFSTVICPHCHTSQKVPALLGSFLLAEVLGMGGMGAVYRGYDQTLGRFVAIKVMKQSMGADASLVESFFREARAAAALNHRNIVQIYACGQEKGQPYIVMELVGGGRLDQMMADGKTISEVRALEIALDVSEGLRAANDAGLVHGDIKPANILFDAAGVAKVVDFGLATFVNSQQSKGEIWGTPFYISPERARGGTADSRSDMYSLGATLFHALSGRPPFDGKTATDVVLARLKEDPPKLCDVVPTLQPETGAAIDRMILMDPVRRYPTTASLKADLRTALEKARAAAPPSAMSRKARKAPEPKKHGKVWIVLVLLAVAAAAGGYYWHKAGEAEKAATAKKESKPKSTTKKKKEPAAKVEPVTPTPQDVASSQFFDENETKRLHSALVALGGDQAADVLKELAAIRSEVPPNSGRALWVSLFEATGEWVLTGDGTARLEAIKDIPISQPPSHALHMPQLLARFMLGNLQAGQVHTRRSSWDPWFGDVVNFYDGMREMTRGRFDSASDLLASYCAVTNREPQWAYGLVPLAERWTNSLALWKRSKEEASALIKSKEPARARELLELTATNLPVFTEKFVKAEIAKAKRAETKAAGKKEESKSPKLSKEDEIKLAADALAAQKSVITGSKDYQAAVEALAAAMGTVSNEDAKKSLELGKEQFERIASLKALMISRMESDPYKQGVADVGGEAVGADAEGVRVAVRPGSVTMKPWSQMTPRAMLRLAAYYANDPAADSRTRADRLLSVAIFCELSDNRDAASRYAAEVLKLDGSRAGDVKRLLPDVTPYP